MARTHDEPVDPVGDLDELLTEDELLIEEQELVQLDRARPTRHQRLGGAPRPFSWLLVASAVVGLWASIELVLTEMKVLEDPLASLGCDINPVIGCGTFITTWQAHVLGPPNAVLGVLAFGALLGVGVMFAAGARPARWFWRLLVLAVLGGLGFVVWFAYQSFAVIGSLCPYCLVTWVVVIVVAFNVLARAAQGGHLPERGGAVRSLVLDRWLMVGMSLGLIVLLAVLVFWDKWMLVFGL